MRFYKIYIELSDICHLTCSFCTPKKGQRGIMPLWLFKKIITQISKTTKLVSLHVLGDPLCLQNLALYLNIAKQNNVKLDIVSSGIFLTQEHFALLCKTNIHQVSFSLDAFYDKGNLKKHQSSSDTYFAQIITFYQYATLHAPWLFINLRLFGNYDYSSLLKYFPNHVKQEEKRRIRLAKNFFLRFHQKFQWYKKTPQTFQTSSFNNRTDKTKPYCLGAIKQLGILANGIVIPCCLDANALMPLGNFTTQNFSEILTNKAIKDFIHAQYTHSNLPLPCTTCTFRGV